MNDFEQHLAQATVASPFPFALAARRWLRLDLGAGNPALHGLDPADAAGFARWIAQQLDAAGADAAAGGYGEDRAVYDMSAVFATPEGERRRVHLGVDLWLPAGTPVHALADGVVHSVQDNAAFGDYGPTLILEHVFGGVRCHALYGHLSVEALRWRPGQPVGAGERLAALGDPLVNGGWPPHLHLQLIRDLQGRRGDFPGACTRASAPEWLARCPDPNLLLRLPALR